MTLRIAGFALIACGLLLGAFVLYRDSTQSELPLTFAPSQMLTALWGQYKINDLEPGSYRTLDKQRGDITTSEGESYTMLRAAWVGDKQVFDASWNWTSQNLARPNDHLFAWLYGKRPDGTWGILTNQSGGNTASDADTDIALALTFAYARWQDPHYLTAARAIMGDIWNTETLQLSGKAYVLADNVEKTSSGQTSLINPSYLSPAAYRIFALVDPSHPWMEAVSGAYSVLSNASSVSLATGTQNTNLPPDWIAIDKTSGLLSATNASGTDSDFGYDALRVPFNLALDWSWYGDPRDHSLLQKYSFLSNTWNSTGQLLATYTQSGTAPSNYNYQTPAMYGGTIGYFSVVDPSDAANIYQNKLAYLYQPDWSGWRQPLTYYDDNWAWFGIGLYNGLLPNLAANVPSSYLAQQ